MDWNITNENEASKYWVIINENEARKYWDIIIENGLIGKI